MKPSPVIFVLNLYWPLTFQNSSFRCLFNVIVRYRCNGEASKSCGVDVCVSNPVCGAIGRNFIIGPAAGYGL